MLRSPPWGLPLHVKQLEKLPRCPWEWWDCRPEKMNVRYLDFKPKKTQDGTWLLKTNKNPPWLVSAMAPAAVQLHNFSWNRRLASYFKAGQHEKTI
jgi:hypothetical protein